MALRALARAPSTTWFSYLSKEISTNLRASSERVERGMLPKSCCLTVGATLEAELLLRAVAGARCDAEVCAHTVVAHNEGKIRRRTRAEKRFMSIDPFFEDAQMNPCRITVACELDNGILAGGTGDAGWLRFGRESHGWTQDERCSLVLF